MSRSLRSTPARSLLLLGLGIASCADDAADATDSSCIPGREVACVCSTGETGHQRCRDDGGGYTACVCVDAGAGGAVTDAGDATAGSGGAVDASWPVTGGAAGVGNAGASGSSGGAGSAGSAGSTDAGQPQPFCEGGLIRDRLSDGVSSGTVSGGTFVPGVGWKTSASSNRIVWDLGQTVKSGTLSFEVKGIHADVSGCLAGVCYYVGLFDEATGDKKGDYTGSAFIESRFHTNDQENFHDVFKLQTGTGNGEILEPLTTPMGWSSLETHAIRVDWGPDPSDASRGRAWLYLDGQQAPLNYQGFYDDVNIAWRYVFLGTTKYKGLDWGMIDVTYKDVCLRTK